MKIIVAPNSFKECLDSCSVANCIERGLKKAIKAKIIKLPLADGGDGTLKSILFSKRGKVYRSKVTGPRWQKVEAEYAILDSEIAVIELASAAGIAILPKKFRNPLYTTTYGVGELIKNAINSGAREIILGVGGSATCDCGAGILASLGVKFFDKDGNYFIPVGGSLIDIKKVDLSQCIKLPKITILCDVANPLLGDDGAKVYLKQKGASNKDIEKIEQGLQYFSSLVNVNTQENGMGAAGGVPYGLSIIGAKLVNGAKFMMKLVEFEKQAKDANLIITGEGEINKNTKYGKVVWEIMQFGKSHKIPVIGVTGKISGEVEELYTRGLTSVFSIPLGPTSLKSAIKNAPLLIESLAERIGRMLSLIL